MQKSNRTMVELKKLAKRNPRFYIHADRLLDVPSYSDEATFTLTGDLGRMGHSEGPYVRFELPGRIGNGSNDETQSRIDSDGRERTSYSGVYRPNRGYWSLWADIFRDIVLTLPNDAELRFNVSLDGGTSELHAPLKIHSDRLYLHATWHRGSRRIERQFLLDAQTGFHNSARFGSPGIHS